MRFNEKLEVHQLEKEETRRGWVRIERKTRKDIDSGSLIVIKRNKGKTRRNVLGVSEGYVGQDDVTGKIFMDEVTRHELGLSSNSIQKSSCDLEINRPNFFGKWFWHAFIFYWSHPDFPVNFASKIAIISMGIGLIALGISFF